MATTLGELGITRRAALLSELQPPCVPTACSKVNPHKGVDLSRLPLTYLAKRHLLARDNAEELLCLRTAALAPHVAKTVYREWPDLPASDTIRAFLISRMSFTARSVDSAVRILCENYAAAGLDRHLIYVALEGEQRGLFENA